jgi:hypothetical protein
LASACWVMAYLMRLTLVSAAKTSIPYSRGIAFVQVDAGILDCGHLR